MKELKGAVDVDGEDPDEPKREARIEGSDKEKMRQSRLRSRLRISSP